MTIQPSFPHSPPTDPGANGRVTRTKNLFEVAVLLMCGVRLDKAERNGDKVTFTFSDWRAAAILDAHRNNEMKVKSRDFVNAINAARDIAFGI